MIHGELIVDNFAGGGGASTGIELATGYSVDIAIDHDPEAIRMHKMNHPNTKHYCEDVWQHWSGRTFQNCVWQKGHQICRSRRSRAVSLDLRNSICELITRLRVELTRF